MRAILFLVTAVLALTTLRASAQPSAPPDPPAICNIWRTQWNDVSAGDAAAPMQAFLAQVPATCRNLRGQITTFIARRFPPPPTTTTVTAPPPQAPARRPPPTTTTTTTTQPVQTATVRRPGDRFRECSECPEMVVIPAGSFTMGSPANEAGRENDEGPQRRISLARDFAVARTEITRGQYAAFVRATGRADGGNCFTVNASGSWAQDPAATWRSPGFAQGEDHPVVCVSWEDAQAYVQWLNSRTRGGYRLLSEAEWEYAARAGTTSAFIWGVDQNAGCAYANGADATARARFSSWTTSTCNDGALFTAAVGGYRANAFGLVDMIGNALEWTQDCYVNTLGLTPTNGSAYETSSCSIRVHRGGGWVSSPQDLRSAGRYRGTPTSRGGNLGFRVARTL